MINTTENIKLCAKKESGQMTCFRICLSLLSIQSVKRVLLSLSRSSALKYLIVSAETSHSVHQVHQIKHEHSNMSGGLVYKAAGLYISGNII